MTSNEVIISPGHYQKPMFKERMTTKQWRAIVLAERDYTIFAGTMTPLVAKKIVCGIVEVSKDLSSHPLYHADGRPKEARRD